MDLVGEFIGPYHLGALLFETENSILYESFHPTRCEKLCLKLIKKDKVPLQMIDDECYIMQEVDHRSIMKCFEIFDIGPYRVIVMPLATGGDLFEYVATNGGMDETASAQVIYTGLTALQHLHSLGIWHRDIKPENFLFLDDNISQINIVLADLGFAKHFNLGETSTEWIGTPTYAAPEIHKKRPYNESVDVWSLGVTMYVILSGEFPFPIDDHMTQLHAIISGDYDFGSIVWDDISPEAKDLIRQMICVDPEQRITVDAALKHPWFQAFFPDSDKTPLQRSVLETTRLDAALDQADDILGDFQEI